MPKTIDNDLWGTDMTFGFQSAVDIATRAIDEIHTTASSHGRVFIVEIMGHKTGWLPLNAGLAGGADIILLPEIPYDLNVVLDVVKKKKTNNHGRFMILAVAEGAISIEDKKLSKKEYQKRLQSYTFPSVSYKLAAEIEEATGKEVRVTIPVIPSAAACRTPTTAFSPAVWALRADAWSAVVNTASWSPIATAKSSKCRLPKSPASSSSSIPIPASFRKPECLAFRLAINSGVFSFSQAVRYIPLSRLN